MMPVVIIIIGEELRLEREKNKEQAKLYRRVADSGHRIPFRISR